MVPYVNEPRIEGPIFGAVVVDSYAPGATLQLGDGGRVVTVNGRDAFYPPPEGYDVVKTTGTISLLVWRSKLRGHEGPGPRSPAAPGTSTATSEVADIINVPAGAAVQLVAANPNRRRVIIQNLSTVAVPISRDPAMANAPAAGAKIEAMLAACAVANDGTGGSITIDGWAGPVFARLAAGAALLAVEAY